MSTTKQIIMKMQVFLLVPAVPFLLSGRSQLSPESKFFCVVTSNICNSQMFTVGWKLNAYIYERTCQLLFLMMCMV